MKDRWRTSRASGTLSQLDSWPTNNVETTHLLLSSASQTRMVFAKGMRERSIHFKDQSDFLDVDRAERSFSRVVCISNFPSGALNSHDCGNAVDGMDFCEDVLHTLEQHFTLVAHPATLEPRTDRAQATTHRPRAIWRITGDTGRGHRVFLTCRTGHFARTGGRTRRRPRLQRPATHPSAASTIRGIIPTMQKDETQLS